MDVWSMALDSTNLYIAFRTTGLGEAVIQCLDSISLKWSL